jgi:hypothetical protein
MKSTYYVIDTSTSGESRGTFEASGPPPSSPPPSPSKSTSLAKTTDH